MGEARTRGESQGLREEQPVGGDTAEAETCKVSKSWAKCFREREQHMQGIEARNGVKGLRVDCEAGGQSDEAAEESRSRPCHAVGSLRAMGTHSKDLSREQGMIIFVRGRASWRQGVQREG